mgnify:CR=1 FL=1
MIKYWVIILFSVAVLVVLKMVIYLTVLGSTGTVTSLMENLLWLD